MLEKIPILDVDCHFRNNPNKARVIKISDDKSLLNSGLQVTDPTVIFFHGFLESSETADCQAIRNGKTVEFIRL